MKIEKWEPSQLGLVEPKSFLPEEMTDAVLSVEKCFLCRKDNPKNAVVLHVRVGEKYKRSATSLCDQCAKDVLGVLYQVDDKLNWQIKTGG